MAVGTLATLARDRNHKEERHKILKTLNRLTCAMMYDSDKDGALHEAIAVLNGTAYEIG